MVFTVYIMVKGICLINSSLAAAIITEDVASPT